MPTPESCGCDDYTASRRTFLKTMAAATGTTVAATMFGETFRQAAYGATNGNVLVVLSLRGGADMLSLVVPHGDPAYYAARPSIAIDAASLVARDASFGLHPALSPLVPMWNAGRVTAVVATGLPVPNRSHFAAVEAVEDAAAGSDVRSGWVNRLIGLDTTRDPLEAVMVGSGLTPAALYGPQPTMATMKTDRISLSGGQDPTAKRRRRQALTQVWSGAGGPLCLGARAALQTTAKLGSTLATAYTPANGARYPGGDLGAAMKDTARLIKAQVGCEVITLDHGSWDMHANVGTLASVARLSMAGMARELGSALAAFFTDLGTFGSRVTVVTITEFGRRVVENGSRGLDHGWGNAMLLLGAGVKGGQYHGTWPGLAYDARVDGDLAVTTDYRHVLAEVLASRFGASPAKVFPGFAPKAVGVMRLV